MQNSYDLNQPRWALPLAVIVAILCYGTNRWLPPRYEVPLRSCDCAVSIPHVLSNHDVLHHIGNLQTIVHHTAVSLDGMPKRGQTYEVDARIHPDSVRARSHVICEGAPVSSQQRSHTHRFRD